MCQHTCLANLTLNNKLTCPFPGDAQELLQLYLESDDSAFDGDWSKLVTNLTADRNLLEEKRRRLVFERTVCRLKPLNQQLSVALFCTLVCPHARLARLDVQLGEPGCLDEDQLRTTVLSWAQESLDRVQRWVSET